MAHKYRFTCTIHFWPRTSQCKGRKKKEENERRETKDKVFLFLSSRVPLCNDRVVSFFCTKLDEKRKNAKK